MRCGTGSPDVFSSDLTVTTNTPVSATVTTPATNSFFARLLNPDTGVAAILPSDPQELACGRTLGPNGFVDHGAVLSVEPDPDGAGWG